MSQPLDPGFTPGPYRWEINLKYKRVYLSGGTQRYDWSVLSCSRWGMQGATVAFMSGRSGEPCRLITPAHEFAAIVPGREHHAAWFQTIDHPDAHLLAAAPDLYRELAHLVNLLEPLEEAGLLAVPGLATLNGARAALAKARGERE